MALTIFDDDFASTRLVVVYALMVLGHAKTIHKVRKALHLMVGRKVWYYRTTIVSLF